MSPDTFLEHWRSTPNNRNEFRLIGIKGISSEPKLKWINAAKNLAEVTLTMHTRSPDAIAAGTVEVYEYNSETKEARLFFDTPFGKPREWETFGSTGGRHGKSKRRRRVIQ